ncbi:hypothetical protein C2845_PM15G14880 [Panicum miliaceum]|uniref:Uncharacterized protein n=1 Tax=Panicum miliaceum TaxID=4540 RepID=A0A3L6Q9P9_PANMI|nr:hypothetical protein C2845_PM15G14880 [Panicum miliaceum]
MEGLRRRGAVHQHRHQLLSPSLVVRHDKEDLPVDSVSISLTTLEKCVDDRMVASKWLDSPPFQQGNATKRVGKEEGGHAAMRRRERRAATLTRVPRWRVQRRRQAVLRVQQLTPVGCGNSIPHPPLASWNQASLALGASCHDPHHRRAARVALAPTP